MKKNILLIFMFMAVFFIGGNRIYADCYSDGINCVFDEINLEKSDQRYILMCLYDITLTDKAEFVDTKNVYYNYIYYDQKKENFIFGSTAHGVGAQGTLENSIVTSNFSCPKNSYYSNGHEYGSSIEDAICFDDYGECTKKEGQTFSTHTATSKLKDYSYKVKALKEGISTDCNNLYGFNNVCSYYTDKTGNTVRLYYKSNETLIVWNDPKTNKDIALSSNGIGGYDSSYFMKNLVSQNINISHQNGITNISSCPKNIYLNAEKDEYAIGTAAIWSTSYDRDGDTVTLNLYKSCNEEKGTSTTTNPTDCTIINDTLRGYINEVMTIIRIGVPILLIGLLIYDFATAVFAGADDKINKVKSKAIKRVIISIVIFFVPTLINFVFDLVNEVWKMNVCVVDESGQIVEIEPTEESNE